MYSHSIAACGAGGGGDAGASLRARAAGPLSPLVARSERTAAHVRREAEALERAGQSLRVGAALGTPGVGAAELARQAAREQALAARLTLDQARFSFARVVQAGRESGALLAVVLATCCVAGSSGGGVAANDVSFRAVPAQAMEVLQLHGGGGGCSASTATALAGTGSSADDARGRDVAPGAAAPQQRDQQRRPQELGGQAARRALADVEEERALPRSLL